VSECLTSVKISWKSSEIRKLNLWGKRTIFWLVRKITKKIFLASSVSLSVYPSALNKSAPTGRIFMKFEKFSKIFWESSSFIKKQQEHWKRMYFYANIPVILFFELKLFQVKAVEKSKHTSDVQIFFFWRSFRLWDNVKKYSRARWAINDNVIRRMRVARWISKATGTHSEYVILIAFTRKQ
jgi:hypothetical protein